MSSPQLDKEPTPPSAPPSAPPTTTTSPSSSTASLPSQSTSSYLSYPITSVLTGIRRRISSDRGIPSSTNTPSTSTNSILAGSYVPPPHRTASPFQPPPLSPLSLNGLANASAITKSQILRRTLAEEIRLLMPARLQLVEDWNLAYSLERDGVSLHTLYQKCERFRGKRAGFVLVVRDGGGGVFGAYLTDPPHPSAHYYGTGECFLWRAHILSATPSLSSFPMSSLPPPPSADTTNMQRSTTAGVPKASGDLLAPPRTPTNGASGTSTPERIRFKAFPYSGVNDYMIFCQAEFLSVGGGDGHYGLWLDDVFEKGISSSCPTFGNEPLSDEGQRFEILGVEVWSVGVS